MWKGQIDWSVVSLAEGVVLKSGRQVVVEAFVGSVDCSIGKRSLIQRVLDGIQSKVSDHLVSFDEFHRSVNGIKVVVLPHRLKKGCFLKKVSFYFFFY